MAEHVEQGEEQLVDENGEAGDVGGGFFVIESLGNLLEAEEHFRADVPDEIFILTEQDG